MNSLSGSTEEDESGRTTSTSFSYPGYEQLRTHNRVSFSVMALAGNGSSLNLGYKGEPGRADGKLVSGTFFSTLGVEPIIGRALTADGNRIGPSPAAGISYRYWERRWGDDFSILGQTVTVNSVPATIVGVSPPEFYGVQPGRVVKIWLPLHSQPQVEPRWSTGPTEPAAGNTAKAVTTLLEARNRCWVLIIGRLKSGVSGQRAVPS